MAKFSSLPSEIHQRIAELCGKSALINLCCTSKWVNERCVQALYRHVDLRLGPDGFIVRTTPQGIGEPPREMFVSLRRLNYGLLGERKRQEQFVHALLSHPEYGKYVRSFRGTLCLPSFDHRPEPTVSEEELWNAMRSLKNVQSVDVGFTNSFVYDPRLRRKIPTKQLLHDLFLSATSVTLMGDMHYLLAKSILNSIDPTTLKYLCLDMVREPRPQGTSAPEGADDGRIKAFGATSGLLTTMTGRCAALRTLRLRRLGQNHECSWLWRTYAEEESYREWASFIRSVQGTVEKFTFEQHERGNTQDTELTSKPLSFRIMDERFRRLILPTIISGDWPCLTLIELIGVRSLNGQEGTAALTVELMALLGARVKILIKEDQG